MRKVYIELIDEDLKRIKAGHDVVYELYTKDEQDEENGEMIEVVARKEPCEHLNF